MMFMVTAKDRLAETRTASIVTHATASPLFMASAPFGGSKKLCSEGYFYHPISRNLAIILYIIGHECQDKSPDSSYYLHIVTTMNTQIGKSA
jgi:hypothetical protein